MDFFKRGVFKNVEFKKEMYEISTRKGRRVGSAPDPHFPTPGPATQLANGYASLFQKTLRKGLHFDFLYVLDFGKKGPFFRECQQFRKKGVFLGHFYWKRVNILELQVSICF